MEWINRRRIGLTVGLAAALAGFVAVCSFAPQDPTFANLRYPKDGIANWLGYPGALAGGSLVEIFGGAALLLPAALAYWTLFPSGRPRGWRYALQTAVLATLAAAWAGQWAPEPGLGLASAGLAGWSGGNWVHSTLGGWLGFPLLTAGLALSLWHQLYAPGLRAALKDVRAAGRLFTRAGAAEARAWLAGRIADAGSVRRNVLAVAVLAPVQILGALMLGAGHAVRRWMVAPLVALAGRMRGTAASLRNIKAHRAARPLPRRRSTVPSAVRSEAQAGRDAAFDGWLLDESEPQPPREESSGAARAAESSGPARVTESHAARSRGAAHRMAEEGRPAGRMPEAGGAPRDEFVRPWEHPADAPLDDAEAGSPGAGPAPDPGRPAARPAASGAERLAGVSRSARESLSGEAGGAPRAAGVPQAPERPELPPAGAGRERWEQLLRRYRENLDLDWDEHGWRAKEEPGPREDGAAKPRDPK